MNKFKLKKYIFLIATLLICALCAMMMVACDEDEPENDDGYGEYETSTYEIVFDSNGGSDFSSYNYIAEYGSKVTKPASIPVKSGYVFAYWTSNGSSAFNFDTETVSGKITLRASYNAKTYDHTYDLTAVLSMDGDEYKLTSGQYATGSLPQGTKLQSTYQLSTNKLAIPTTSKTGDKFCFWYYVNNGTPVQFSKWAQDGDTNVEVLSKYTFTRGLELYPMWYSTLPSVSVTFADSKSDDTYGSGSVDVKIGDYLAEGYIPSDVTKVGYEFKEWYYISQLDGEDVETEFVFDDLSDTSDSPTNLSKASGTSSVFDNVTLTLYAKWTKLVSITSVSEFNAVKDVLNGDDSQLIEEYLSAKITIAGTIDFGMQEISPLFGKTQVFVGVIDGGTYDQNDNVTQKAILKGGVLKGESHASIFGYVGGTVKNLSVENVSVKIEQKDGAYDGRVAVGLLASVNTGTISNCPVTQSALVVKYGEVTDGVLQGGLSKLVLGGVCAENAGEVIECTVDIDGLDVLAKSLTFGGIAGENSKISLSNSASVDVVSIVLASDGVPSTNSMLKLGGIIGEGGGAVSECVANLSIVALDVDGGANLGGVVGDLGGSVSKCQATFTLCSQSTPAIVGGAGQSAVAIGGLVGKHGGAIANSVAQADIFASGKKANSTIIVGGLVGNNFNATTSSTVGSVKTSYAQGSINVSVADTLENVTVYAAGLVGRNSQTGIASSFTLTTITVTNSNATAQNKLGYVIGSMESNSTTTISSAWFLLDLSVMLNGSTYINRDDVQNLFEINTTGSVAHPDTDLKNSTFVKNKLGFSSDIWNIVDGSLPTLKG